MITSILNRSDGKWAFSDLAEILSKTLWIDVSESEGDINYVLCIEPEKINSSLNSFISLNAIKTASDKRLIEQKFALHNVKRPKTFIIESLQEVESFLSEYDRHSWVLKYPIGCGGIHHRIVENVSQIPEQWESPYLLQKFIKSSKSQVYRVYCIDKDLFSFNVRKFLSPENTSPWVSHANGARYSYEENSNKEAIKVAKTALIATGLYDSFGVVDLVEDISGNWYALEVGTDGIYNYVDRDIDNNILSDEINERLAIAFWKRVGSPPWGKTWKYRE